MLYEPRSTRTAAIGSRTVGEGMFAGVVRSSSGSNVRRVPFLMVVGRLRRARVNMRRSIQRVTGRSSGWGASGPCADAPTPTTFGRGPKGKNSAGGCVGGGDRGRGVLGCLFRCE